MSLSTLPLYATFLDDPFDPSPYSPISRLHWNEVYLDDEGLPDAPAPVLTDHVDWRALGARRRAQLLEAARRLDADQRARLDAFVAAHPDVADYARFLAGQDAGADAHVEESHVLAQYLADQQLRAIADDPDGRRAGTRPPDRFASPRLRGVGRRIDVRRSDECRCAP